MDRAEAEEVHRKWATAPEPEITPKPISGVLLLLPPDPLQLDFV